MEPKTYRIIGMMSGTSLDGVDLAFCHFTFCKQWQYQLFSAKTYAYTNEILALIKVMELESTSFLLFKAAERKYSQYLGQVIKRFIEEHHLKEIDYVSIHGHTIFHQPKSKITVQIANLSTVAAQLGLNVIGNFRQLDVMRGGEGAPLAPYGQELFQGDVYVNFGGICNIGVQKSGWDINYCNLFFNYYAHLLESAQFDKDGQIGRKGTSNHQLAQFFHTQFINNQKESLGRQGFERFIQLINKNFTNLSKYDIVRTFYQFLAKEINRAVISSVLTDEKLRSKIKQENKLIKVLCTGGGAKNTFLMELLRQLGKQRAEYILPNQKIIDFKQAIIFAFLGLKYIENIRNCGSGVGGCLVKGSY